MPALIVARHCWAAALSGIGARATVIRRRAQSTRGKYGAMEFLTGTPEDGSHGSAPFVESVRAFIVIVFHNDTNAIRV